MWEWKIQYINGLCITNSSDSACRLFNAAPGLVPKIYFNTAILGYHQAAGGRDRGKFMPRRD
jgi:hypothetical protein